MSNTKSEEHGFAHGLAWAVGILASRGENTLAGELIRESGLERRDFIEARTADYDMSFVNKIAESEGIWSRKRGAKKGGSK